MPFRLVLHFIGSWFGKITVSGSITGGSAPNNSVSRVIYSAFGEGKLGGAFGIECEGLCAIRDEGGPEGAGGPVSGCCFVICKERSVCLPPLLGMERPETVMVGDVGRT